MVNIWKTMVNIMIWGDFPYLYDFHMDNIWKTYGFRSGK